MLHDVSRLACVLALVAVAACRTAPDGPPADAERIGTPMSSGRPLPLADLAALETRIGTEPVLVEATVRDVCARQGCWMQVEDGANTALVRWNDGCGGAFKFPQDAVGKRVVVEGTVRRAELSDVEVEHLREEAKRGLDPARSRLEIHVSSVAVLRGSS